VLEIKTIPNKKSVLSYLKAHKADLLAFKVHSIGLFGSYLRGQHSQDSDIDFLVEFEPGNKTFDNFIGLIDYLENAFGKRVDLVTRESVSKYILPHIEKEIEYVQVVN
jgi:predicted nucleotidyltransferase